MSKSRGKILFTNFVMFALFITYAISVLEAIFLMETSVSAVSGFRFFVIY